MRHVLSALVLSLLLSPAALAEDDNTHEMKAAMDAFAEAFAGTWVQERTLDNDLPGIAKKGDTLVAHITYTPKDGLILVDWKAEVNGKPAGATAKGLVGWDAAQKKLRMRWFTTAGSSGTNVYWQQDDRWIRASRYLQADGTQGSNRAVLRFPSENKHVARVTNRKQGEETLPPRTDTWTRESK
mgnify:CR=1 FL=1